MNINSNDIMTVSSSGVLTSTNTILQTTAAKYIPDVSEQILDKYMMNQLVCEHKVSEHEILKLKEVKPDFADAIKENIARNISREVIKKTFFTKKKLPDEDTHHFIGRVWCFTTEELKQLIKDTRNA
jgi:hypothetical protein